MNPTINTTDRQGAGGIRIFKVKKDFAADENVPRVLQPYEPAWLKVIPGDGETEADMKSQVYIEKNGMPLITNHETDTGVDVYPGVTPSEGDLKFTAGLSTGDVLMVRYEAVRYAESQAAE